MIVGIGIYMAEANFRRVAIETTAVITSIVVSRGSESDSRDVFVRFDVHGQEYRGRIDWRRGMAVGREVTVFYNPDNPQNFITRPNHLGMLFSVFIGGVCLSICLGGFYKQFKYKSLFLNGKRITATFIELKPGNIKMGDQKCCNLICEYHDEISGIAYLFKSENIWTVPYFGHQQIPLVPVFVDPCDYSKYYVVVDEFFGAIEAQNNITDYSQRVG